MLALHVQLRSHLVAVVCPQIFIQRLVVARYTAADAGCMSREDGGDFRLTTLENKRCKARLPFVRMEDDLVFFTEIKLIETLYDKCRSVSEHGRFIIITVSVETVNLVILP